MDRRSCFLWLVLLLTMPGLFLAGCQNFGKQDAGSKTTVTLTLSVAASLTEALTEIKELYEQENPQVKLQLNFGGSGTLEQQIEQGAPVDIFIAAAAQPMDKLQEKGLLVDDSRQVLLVHRLALIAPLDSRINNFAHLAHPEIKIIAIGEPQTVPAGQYAREVLENLELWEQLQGKFTFAKDVREVLAFVETGNADAGMVYQTDAQLSKQVQMVALAPEGSHEPVVYPLAVIKNSPNQEAARRLIQFMTSVAGKAVFEKYGFTTRF